MRVDLASILSIDHDCDGCLRGEPCCCSAYEVCVTTAELERIIPVLPGAARFCPHLETGGGYDNIFDEVEPGLFAIDTDDEGLCLLAFRSGRKVRCSLHAAAATLGLTLAKVKPKACLLWPMAFSEGKEVLSLIDDALVFRCNTLRRGRSSSFFPAFVNAVDAVYGKGIGGLLEQETARGALLAVVSCRR
ncbi:MAG: hypothetical protein HGA43_03450 [Nitrospirae bacterium]|nr:hypothetical protein [Nitrospirota bacterium]